MARARLSARSSLRGGGAGVPVSGSAVVVMSRGILRLDSAIYAIIAQVWMHGGRHDSPRIRRPRAGFRAVKRLLTRQVGDLAGGGGLPTTSQKLNRRETFGGRRDELRVRAMSTCGRLGEVAVEHADPTALVEPLGVVFLRRLPLYRGQSGVLDRLSRGHDHYPLLAIERFKESSRSSSYLLGR